MVYEPIEGMMAQPDRRGLGTIGDDLYALGVTVVALLKGGQQPCANIPDQTLVEQKLREGSYDVITRGMEISPNLALFLRGVLNDHLPARWYVSEVKEWAGGRSLTRRVVPPPVGPARKFDFLGEPAPSMRMLGYILAGMPAEAAVMIRDKSLEAWLIRAFGGREGAAFVTNAVGGTGDHPPSGDAEANWLVARVCMALDPFGPIRFGDYAIAPDAVGTAMAIALLKGSPGGARQLAELLSLRLPAFWLTRHTPAPPTVQTAIFAFDPVKKMLDNEMFGYGVERAVYELVPGLRCLSPLVEAAYVVDPADLLPALESAVKEGRVTGLPIDRHIAAFIATRAVGRQDDSLLALTRGDAAERGLGVLKMLVALKGAALTASLPQLTQLLAVETKGLVTRIHHRELRTRLQARIADAAQGGNLSELLKVVNDHAAMKQDTARFQQGRIEYRMAEIEVMRVKKTLAGLAPRSQALGNLIGFWLCLSIAILACSVIFSLRNAL
jgi:hypothetical protein